MLVGVPKEIKDKEYRVGLMPAAVKELTQRGHSVLVETQAGVTIGFSDDDYRAAGASIENTAQAIFARSELIVKVKEPQAEEYQQLREGQLLFTYLHLAPDPAQAKGLMSSGVTAIAYETVTDDRGGLPLLAPMSEVAGRLAVQAGAHHLEIAQGGCGTLLGGVTGVAPAHVLIIGGGVVGSNAAFIAQGMGARVTLLDRSLSRLRQLDEQFNGRIQCLYASTDAIEQCLASVDLVVGAVLIPGASAPKLLSREQVAQLRPGSVLVDVAIDQGGCFATSRPTTHTQPTYVEQGVTHYCVANMPSAAARTATMALNHATLPYVIALADQGLAAAVEQYAGLKAGINVHRGHLCHPSVAASLELTCQPWEDE